jgi:PmbA protein
MKAYQEILSSVPGVSAWVLRRTRSIQHQRYLLHDRPECERTVEETTLTATVFNDHEGGQGQASFTLFGAEAPLDRSQVEDAVFMASLQTNPAYALPEPAPMPAVEIRDPDLRGDHRQVLDGIQDRVFAAMAGLAGKPAAGPPVRLSAAEVFLDRIETEIVTSTGVEASKEETSLLFDLVILARDGSLESESHGEYSRRRLSHLNVEEAVARHARFARDTLHAELPATRNGPVVLNAAVVIPLFTPFKFATAGGSLYRKISPLVVGEPVFGDRKIAGDVLTLASDATLPFGVESTPFDGEGLALGSTRIIDGGTFRAVAASKQYADYLQVAATGSWRNAVLRPGGTSLDELLNASTGPLYHIVDFSFLNPDVVRGTFSTEIRLGYEIAPGGTRVIKGGSLSGNVYDAFAAAHFARETELWADYFGPVGIRFDELQVTGSS